MALSVEQIFPLVAHALFAQTGKDYLVSQVFADEIFHGYTCRVYHPRYNVAADISWHRSVEYELRTEPDRISFVRTLLEQAVRELEGKLREMGVVIQHRLPLEPETIKVEEAVDVDFS